MVCGVSPLVILFLSVLVKVLIGVLVDKLYYSPFLERLCATQKSYSFCIACHYGRDTVVRGLLESEVDVNGMATVFDLPLIQFTDEIYIGTWTPMTFAANNGHFDIVKMLIDAGADVNGGIQTNGPHCTLPLDTLAVVARILSRCSSRLALT